MAKKEKEEKSPALDFQKAMQTKLNQITKDLKVTPVGFDAPEGTNGAISTGVLCLDLITGGGFPRHRMTTVSGESGAGKTTLISKAMGTLLRNKKTLVHYEDLEGAADYQWMLQNGTDMNEYLGKKGKPKTLYYIPDFESGDDSLRYVNRVLEVAGELDTSDLGVHSNVFFYDSLAAAVSEELIENDEAGSKPYLAALLSRYIPMIRSRLKRANAAFIGINQLRENPRARFGNPLYEPGGNSPTFYADLKLWLETVGKAKRIDDPKKEHPITPKDSKFFKAGGYFLEENPDGTVDKYRFTHIKTVKNRVFPPLKETFMRVWVEENGITGRGIDPVWDTIRFYEEVGLAKFNSMDDVELKGVSYAYWDLKTEILKNPDLGLEARSLIDSGEAFKLYFNRLSGGGQEVGAPDSEE